MEPALGKGAGDAVQEPDLARTILQGMGSYSRARGWAVPLPGVG